MILKLKFKFEKETPGTVRYQEVGADGNPASAPSVPMLYVRKSAMPDESPAVRLRRARVHVTPEVMR